MLRLLSLGHISFQIWSKQLGVINHWFHRQIDKKCSLIFSSIWILLMLINFINQSHNPRKLTFVNASFWGKRAATHKLSGLSGLTCSTVEGKCSWRSFNIFITLLPESLLRLVNLLTLHLFYLTFTGFPLVMLVFKSLNNLSASHLVDRQLHSRNLWSTSKQLLEQSQSFMKLTGTGLFQCVPLICGIHYQQICISHHL